MDIKISVLMCVYNTQEAFLREAIESILKQTMKDFEFIIVNDASNEQTVNILNEYDDSRIVRINNDVNVGLTASLNRGLAYVQGKYIARMDADDISYPKRFELQYKYMEKHPEVAVLGCWTSSSGKIAKYQGHASSDWRKTRMLIENVGIAHPTAFMRTDFLKSHHLTYDVSIKKSQDYELWTRCLEFGRIAICPHVLLEYRVHDGQISCKNADEQTKAKREIRTRLIEKLDVEFSVEELEQFLAFESINLTPHELAVLLDKVVRANERTGYYDTRILKRELTFIWLKVILGVYKSNGPKQFWKTHWFYRVISPAFCSYIVWNVIIRNI